MTTPLTLPTHCTRSPDRISQSRNDLQLYAHIRNNQELPMFDLIVRNANLPDGREKQDILVKDGKIADIIPSRGEHQTAQEIDATDRLVTPPFVDPHFHIDATLSLGLPRLNRSGTLLECVEIWVELKLMLTVEAMVEGDFRY